MPDAETEQRELTEAEKRGNAGRRFQHGRPRWAPGLRGSATRGARHGV